MRNKFIASNHTRRSFVFGVGDSPTRSVLRRERLNRTTKGGKREVRSKITVAKNGHKVLRKYLLITNF